MNKTGRQRLRKVFLRSTAAVFFTVVFAAVIAFTLAACDKGGTGGGGGDDSQTEVTITELVVYRAPKKTVYYEGESFDGKGMVLQALRSDGTKKTLTLKQCTYEPTGALSATDTEITVTYNGKSVKQPIQIAKLRDITFSAAALEGKQFPTVGSVDVTNEITVTGTYIDGKNEIVKENVVIEDYSLVLDYQPASGEADKPDVICDNPKELEGFKKGNYQIYAKVGNTTSAQKVNVTAFSGFIAEAENVYDAQYGTNKKPVNAETYQNYGCKPLPESESELPKYYTLIEKLRPGNGSAANYSQGAGALIFPNDKQMPGASGGHYLGETKIVRIYSFHIYSEIDTEAEMFVNVSSAVIIDWYMSTASLQMNKAFELYIGEGAYNGETDTWDDSKKVQIADSVEIKGTNFRDPRGIVGSPNYDEQYKDKASPEHQAAIDEFKALGINVDDYKCSRWSHVSLGTMQVKKGWNVIYLRNMFYDNTEYVEKRGDRIYINGVDKGQGTNWGFNLDSFELAFKEEETNNG